MGASTGQQVGYPLLLTESGERRRAQEKAIRLTLGFRQKNIAEAKQRSKPILRLGLNSGLGLKGSNEQVKGGALRGKIPQGQAEVAGYEMENLLRNTDST